MKQFLGKALGNAMKVSEENIGLLNYQLCGRQHEHPKPMER